MYAPLGPLRATCYSGCLNIRTNESRDMVTQAYSVGRGRPTLASAHPEVVARIWDPSNNLDPTQLSPSSGRYVRWYCEECNNTWAQKIQAQVNKKDPLRGPGCRHPLSGASFGSEHPDLIEFWDPNNDQTPYSVKPSSTYRATWILPDGTRSTRRVVDVHKNGTPYRRPTNPVASEPYAAEWDPENAGSPLMIGRSSKEPVTWICRECGTKWDTTPFNRFKGHAPCPSCTAVDSLAEKERRERVLEEKVQASAQRRERKRQAREELKELRRKERAEAADQRRVAAAQESGRTLLRARPELAAQVVVDSPLYRDPDTVTIGSGYSLDWECEKGHIWTATLHDRCGKNSGCPVCTGRRTEPGHNDLEKLFPAIAAEWMEDRNGVPASRTIPGSNTPGWWHCSTCGHEWVTQPNYRCYQGYGCTRCSHHGNSRAEDDLAEQIGALPGAGEVRRHEHLFTDGREVDIVLPEHHLAVEFNGLFWHTEDQGKGRNYHRDKSRDAAAAGFRLVHVWEDEWATRPDVVLAHIASVIGADIRPRIGARQCTVELNLGKQDADAMLDTYHIQGTTAGSLRYGLRGPDGSLAAVMIVKRDGGVYSIVRYATSCRVPGGFTRLLTRLQEHIAVAGGGSIITFSDTTVSTGELYARTGFVCDQELAPDYRYVVGKERRHKFGYRLDRFRTDPSLEYQEGLTERELAHLNGLSRIWDAGKRRWRLDVPSAVETIPLPENLS